MLFISMCIQIIVFYLWSSGGKGKGKGKADSSEEKTGQEGQRQQPGPSRDSGKGCIHLFTNNFLPMQYFMHKCILKIRLPALI